MKDSIVLEFNGESMSVGAWAKKIGISKSTLWGRIGRCWTIEKALTAEVSTVRKRKITHKGDHEKRVDAAVVKIAQIKKSRLTKLKSDYILFEYRRKKIRNLLDYYDEIVKDGYTEPAQLPSMYIQKAS